MALAGQAEKYGRAVRFVKRAKNAARSFYRYGMAPDIAIRRVEEHMERIMRLSTDVISEEQRLAAYMEVSDVCTKLVQLPQPLLPAGAVTVSLPSGGMHDDMRPLKISRWAVSKMMLVGGREQIVNTLRVLAQNDAQRRGARSFFDHQESRG